ncbi:alkaline phosphatase family protein [Aquabacterium lacunae]|uniref:Alkaline phosphatase family protein n=1 Tax=Aquabacterium lacunae TaxID=2528630 RepID=A0A4Q9GXY7_9BURK|nr:alkaline phosphatase D family protein [Aquabacterium lacunae]TBO28749.1 alkaline phosphatase family protein [Aquabacterium lacunae]
MASEIWMGPVLSFRGIARTGKKAVWKVSALVVVPAGQPAPVMVLQGKAVSARRLLSEQPMTGANGKPLKAEVWRHDLSVVMTTKEQRVSYGLQGQADASWRFTVPAQEQAPRMAYFSCNGFSDPKAMKSFKPAAQAVWQDLLNNHDVQFRPSAYVVDREQQWHEERVHKQQLQRFHLLIGGGDQVYMDGVWSDPGLKELKTWTEWDEDQQATYVPPAGLLSRIKAYYLGVYLQRWARSVAGTAGCGQAFATSPTVMMWDDHDIFDGWGSYGPKLQKCPLLQAMFRIAREAFWVFQLQMPSELLPELTDRNPQQAKDPWWAPVDWAAVSKADPLSLAFLPKQAGFSHRLVLPELTLNVMDLRTDRSQLQVLSADTWEAWKSVWKDETPATATGHQLIISSVPVVHPKLSTAETITSWQGDDVVEGLGDDLNDHWAHDRHEDERKRLVRTLMQLAQDAVCRVTIVSGDVHVAAWGNALRKTSTRNVHRINQLTSTAIVHPSLFTWSEKAFLMLLRMKAAFTQDLDTEHQAKLLDFPGTSSTIQATRNWLALEFDADRPKDDAMAMAAVPVQPKRLQGRLWATWRCERAEGFSNHLMAVHPATP